jgi:hypothetical protein
MRSYVFIVLSMAIILLISMSSGTTIMAEMDASHKRDKRFFFGSIYPSHKKSHCRRRRAHCYREDSKCCSGHCEGTSYFFSRCN